MANNYDICGYDCEKLSISNRLINEITKGEKTSLDIVAINGQNLWLNCMVSVDKNNFVHVVIPCKNTLSTTGRFLRVKIVLQTLLQITKEQMNAPSVKRILNAFASVRDFDARKFYDDRFTKNKSERIAFITTLGAPVDVSQIPRSLDRNAFDLDKPISVEDVYEKNQQLTDPEKKYIYSNMLELDNQMSLSDTMIIFPQKTVEDFRREVNDVKPDYDTLMKEKAKIKEQNQISSMQTENQNLTINTDVAPGIQQRVFYIDHFLPNFPKLIVSGLFPKCSGE